MPGFFSPIPKIFKVAGEALYFDRLRVISPAICAAIV
jgi:hypothetical protein